MKKLIIKSGLILLGLVIFSSASLTRAEEITLRFSSPFPIMQTITGKVIKPWIDQINETAKGKLKIQLYPACALGKAPDQYMLAEKGIADLAYHLSDYSPGRFPMTTVFSLPFMVPSGEKVSAAMWKTFEKEEKYREEYGKVKVLALFGHSGGNFHTVKKSIQNMADFQGLKMRIANPAISEALKIWGATPVAMPITETYESLERNIIDGTVLNYEGMGVFKLNEVCKYTTVVELYTMPMMIVMNKQSWDKLPADVKELFESTTGLKMSMAAGAAFDGMEKPFREKCLNNGMKEIILDPAELEKLKESTMPLRASWVKEYSGKGFPAQQVLDTALEYLNE